MSNRTFLPCVNSMRWMLTISIFACMSSRSHADIMVFNNRADWQTAAGGTIDILVDFNSIVADIEPLTVAVDFGPLSIVSTESETIVDATPFIPPGTGGVDGTTHLAAQLDEFIGAEIITMTFDRPVNAFGFDVRPFSLNGQVNVSTSGGDTGSLLYPNAMQVEFRGFVADAPFTEVSFSSQPGANVVDASWDNLSARTVPEPSAFLLLGLVSLCNAIHRFFARAW